MKAPPRWTETQLTVEAERSITLFRRERLGEPLEKWKNTFDQYQEQFETLFNEYGIAYPSSLSHEQLSKVFKDKLGDALRYITAPPISADDLKVLAEASLAPSRIAADKIAAKRILDIISETADPRRFPWISEGRTPSEIEKAGAILASAALITAQRVRTERSNEGKEVQEQAVKQFLTDMNFEEVAPREIQTLADAPEPGQFCAESLVGSRKADVPVRLLDGRLMPIECKVSNSSTNSVKRLNNDAAIKAVTWHREFGTKQVVPTAMLSGVFKVRNLRQAQESGLTLFWAHKLEDMHTFIEATRS